MSKLILIILLLFALSVQAGKLVETSAECITCINSKANEFCTKYNERNQGYCCATTETVDECNSKRYEIEWSSQDNFQDPFELKYTLCPNEEHICGKYYNVALSSNDIVIAPENIPANGMWKYLLFLGSIGQRGIKLSGMVSENVNITLYDKDDNSDLEFITHLNDTSDYKVKLPLYGKVLLTVQANQKDLKGKFVIRVGTYGSSSLTTLEIVLIVLVCLLAIALICVIVICCILRKKSQRASEYTKMKHEIN